MTLMVIYFTVNYEVQCGKTISFFDRMEQPQRYAVAVVV